MNTGTKSNASYQPAILAIKVLVGVTPEVTLGGSKHAGERPTLVLKSRGEPPKVQNRGTSCALVPDEGLRWLLPKIFKKIIET